MTRNTKNNSPAPRWARIEGGQVPHGVIKLSGAKNSATRLLAATLLGATSTVLNNFPTRLVDVQHAIRFIRGLGVDVRVDDIEQSITVTPEELVVSTFGSEDEFPIRTTYLLVAGQILRNGLARVPYPGGCKIGSRGYDQHVMVWTAMGCEVEETPTALEVKGDGFKGGEIDFTISTVGGTENALMCAAVAKGNTQIRNAYVTPEIEDLIDLLRRMGSRIEVIGGSLIEVQGVDRLGGARFEVMADRVEALTWIVYAVISGGSVRIDRVPFSAMEIPLIHLRKAGIDLLQNSDSVYIDPECYQRGVQPFELACGAHPGVISDMQPFYVLLALIADGRSKIFDYRYPERIAYIEELAKLCGPGSLEARPGAITINGKRGFNAAHVRSTDLRGSMSLVMVALCAPGESRVDDVHMALRGYNDLEAKLAQLGVRIEVLSD